MAKQTDENTIKMDLINEIDIFLKEKFIFKIFEIDEWIYNKKIIRFVLKERFLLNNNSIENNLLMNLNTDNWSVIESKSMDFFWFEFYLWSIKDDIKKTRIIKAQKKDIKKILLNKIETEIAEIASIDPKIKSFLNMERIIVKGIKPIKEDLRKPYEVFLGNKYFICRESTTPYIVDPCIVYEIDNSFDDTMYNIMYFSNSDEYRKKTNKIEINSYGFLKVTSIQIGRTPEEAVNNQYN